MEIKDSTTPIPATTLTEEQLFREFLESEFGHYDRLGRHLFDHSVRDLLDSYSDYAEIDLHIDNAGDDPSDHLREVENSLRSIADNVQLVLEAFEKLKSERLVVPAEPDEADAEAYEAWGAAYDEAEKNPRYLPVAAAGFAQEAA